MFSLHFHHIQSARSVNTQQQATEMNTKTLILIACLISVTTSLAGDPSSDSEQDEMENCEDRKRGSFTFYDYSVVIAMLTISLKIGVFYGFFEKPSDFISGSGMSIFPVTLSLASSFITAIELLGNPAEIYFYGAQFSLIGETWESRQSKTHSYIWQMISINIFTRQWYRWCSWFRLPSTSSIQSTMICSWRRVTSFSALALARRCVLWVEFCISSRWAFTHLYQCLLQLLHCQKRLELIQELQSFWFTLYAYSIRAREA